MKEKYYINLRNFLLISLISIFISLFIVNGPFWLLLSLVEWILFVYVLWIIYLRHSSKQKTKWNIPEFFKGFIITLIILLPLLLSLVSYPIIMIPITYVRAEANRAEVEELVFDITKNCTTNESKVISLLNWFERESGNIKNIWSGKSLGPLKFLGYSPKDWIICVRTLERKPALFVFTSRCGACEEHSVLFREMANVAGLQVRSVICHGIDHLWDEVLIDEQWLIVDPANVVFSKNKSGYNLSAESFERGHAGKTHNISYVFAEYPDRSVEEITYRYAGNLSCINITTVDENLKPVSNVEITVFSNNKFTKRNTGLSFHTDGFGKYQLSIGGGSVTFESISNDFIPLYGEKTRYFNDSESYDLILVLKGDWTKSIPLTILIVFSIISITIIDVYFGLRKKKRKNKEIIWKEKIMDDIPYLDLYKEKEKNRRDYNRVEWETLKFFTTVFTALLTVTFIVIGYSITNSNSENLLMKELWVFCFIPLSMLIISFLGLVNFKRECARNYETIATLAKIEKKLGFHARIDVVDRLFPDDKYILPNRFVEENKGIKSTDDFVEKMFKKSFMGKFGRFYFTGKWLFIFYMFISIILLLILLYLTTPNLFLLYVILLIPFVLILHILWLRINKKDL